MRTGKIKLFLTVLLIALIFQSSNQQDTLGLQAKIAANQGGNTGVGDETQPLSSSLSQTSVNELLLPADNTDSKETVDLGRPARAKPQMKRTLIEPLADRLLVNSATTDLTSSSRRSPISIQAYTPFSPILIDGNGQFASWNQTWGWEGDGSKNRPYIIDNYRIADSLNPLISIQNTDVYFEIKDNLLNGINGNFPGIELINVSHGIIDNNTIHSCSNGIYMDSHYPIFVGKLISHNNTISRNEIYNSSNRGIEVYSSNQTMISSNYCY
ncbi:MAG: right-handed parallel beta-helix repeat-containing protein, partial [Candidatus Hodarchaeota archaeon]